MKTEIIILGSLVLALVLLVYGVKYRFRLNSRVRYLSLYKNGDAYMSHDAFWKFKYLRRKLLLFIAYPSLRAFIPLVCGKVKLADDLWMTARGYFKNKTIILRTKAPIRAIYRMKPEYHISVNAHFNIRETSRRIANSVPFDEHEAELEYAKNYLVLLDDDTGYIMKIRK